MLTKTDLAQIRKLVREEVETEGENIRTDLLGEMKLMRMGIQNDLRILQDRVKNVEVKANSLDKSMTSLEGRMEKLENRITKMYKDLKGEIKKVLNFLDRENVAAVHRIKRIEDHLGLQSPTGF